MPARKIKTVSIIGAGTVARRLGLAFLEKGIRVTEVCNRSAQAGRALANKLNAAYVQGPSEMADDADLVLVSVTDTAIGAAIKGLNTRALVVHTSGSVEMAVLKNASPRIGVFYPLQTFRKGRRLPVSRIPFCIEAATSQDEESLVLLAQMISGKATVLDSGQRRVVHLAAVFACNFTNYMYSVAEDLLREQGIPFGLLQPIIIQTAGNAAFHDLHELQTGPAVREDERVMGLQRQLLKSNPDYQKLYDLISDSIIQQKRKHDKL